MSTLNDLILASVGGVHLVDGLREFYLANGAISGTLNDLELQYLRSVFPAGGAESSINDLWMNYLNSLGYSGTLNDRLFQFWSEMASAWSPLALFSAGEKGVWFDPSDLSTMFQDSAGTTPVTATGQPVGKILDKSGNNKHATQATAAARPLFRDVGGLRYLEFDGVDDSLATAAIDFTSTYTMSTFYGVMVKRTGIYGAFLGNGVANSAGMAGKFAIYLPSNNATTGRNDFGGIAVSNKINMTIQTGVNFIGAQLLDSLNSPYQKVRKDGVQTATGTSDVGGQAFLNRELKISDVAWIGSAGPFEGNVYSIIVRGALSDAAQIAAAESYIAGKSGVTLP